MGKLSERQTHHGPRLITRFHDNGSSHACGHSHRFIAASGAGRALLQEDPFQEHRDKKAKQDRDCEHQPAGLGFLPLPLAVLRIGRPFTLMLLHASLVSRTRSKHKKAQ
jgi:hypothetical protein